MSELYDHEKVAMAEYARRKQEERRATGDRSVPGFPEAESSAGFDIGSEPADLGQDSEVAALVRFSSDQGDAAADHAAPYDNTDDLGLRFSTRLEALLKRIREQVRANEWHYMQSDDGKNWTHLVSRDEKNYTMSALKGAILGVVTPSMLRRGDQFLYVIAPGSIPKWLEYVDRAGWRSCAVRRCARRNYGPSDYPNVEIVVVRGQWLYEVPVCSGCLNWLRHE
ncbi:hypothetical protein ABGB19_23445 [Mycobacterium sp. B14F4]|uniref:hypothetical protein n=1 Tax=Mycobacterium sp. B14F4 TaxID=3153565 RepID=UPI00325DC279